LSSFLAHSLGVVNARKEFTIQLEHGGPFWSISEESFRVQVSSVLQVHVFHRQKGDYFLGVFV
jgi:hypothetical protein